MLQISVLVYSYKKTIWGFNLAWKNEKAQETPFVRVVEENAEVEFFRFFFFCNLDTKLGASLWKVFFTLECVNMKYKQRELSMKQILVTLIRQVLTLDTFILLLSPYKCYKMSGEVCDMVEFMERR